MAYSPYRRPSPTLEDESDFFPSDCVAPVIPSRPTKRAKRTHSGSSDSSASSPTCREAKFAASPAARLESPSHSDDELPPAEEEPSSSRPPPAPLPPAITRSRFRIDTRGIRDELVKAVIEHLQQTNNTPVTAKELTGLLVDRFDVVRASPKPTVLVSSRLTAYLKRSWSALAPCPISKIASGLVTYYLTTHPNQPPQAAVAAAQDPFSLGSADEHVDMESSMDDILSAHEPVAVADSEDDLESTDAYSTADELGGSSVKTPLIDPVQAPETDLFDPEFHGFDLGVLLEHPSASFPPINGTKRSSNDRTVYALPLLEQIESDFHQAACRSRAKFQPGTESFAGAPYTPARDPIESPFQYSFDDPFASAFLGDTFGEM